MSKPDLIQVGRSFWDVYVHEAGHACVAIALGQSVDRIEKHDREDVEGTRGGSRTRGRMIRSDPAQPVLAFDAIRVALAGGEAERRYFGFVQSAGDWGDVDHAREIIGDVFNLSPSDPEVDEYIKLFREMARDDVAEHWAWICATAQALTRCRVLSGAEIAALRPRKEEKK